MQRLAFLNSTDCMETTLSKSAEILDVKPSPLLKELLRRGYEVVVITSRTEFTEDDKCWMDLIPRENVYHPIGKNHPYDGVNNPAMIAAWAAVFNRFNLTPPTDTTTWTKYKWAAIKQGVLI